MKPITVTLGGKRWRFLREPPHKANLDGDCDPPTEKNKAIRVHPKTTGWDELYAIIHEARHAENWEMYAEPYVVSISRDLANLLWRLGYRKLEPTDSPREPPR